jgi:2-methylcitrate dehydratase PrpD
VSTAAERLAAFTAAIELDEVPRDVAAAAKLHVLDVLGCGLAAHAVGEARYAAAAAVEAASHGPATAIGLEQGLPAHEAAFVNGTLCHALDYDDTHAASVVHVSASVVPAALAAAELHGCSGKDTLAAIVAGNEVSTRLGAAAGGLFHARGFHPTGVCGVFGATAAAARLRGLDARTTTDALGIAGSMASGLLEFLADGSETKRLHPGWAAQGGMTAARLAAHGATGPATVLEGRRGLYGAYLSGAHADVEGQLSDLGARWATLEIAFKPYPACHYVHAPVDALAQILGEVTLEAEDVAEMLAFSDETGVPLVLDPLEDKLRPRTAYDAKFSLPYCLAALLVHGRLGVESFTEEAIADDMVLAVTPRVRYELKEYAAAPDAFPGGVRVVTRDGRTFEAELRYQRGGIENPMSKEDVRAKYRANAELALDPATARELEAAILDLESQPDVGAAALLARAQAREAAAV